MFYIHPNKKRYSSFDWKSYIILEWFLNSIEIWYISKQGLSIILNMALYLLLAHIKMWNVWFNLKYENKITLILPSTSTLVTVFIHLSRFSYKFDISGIQKFIPGAKEHMLIPSGLTENEATRKVVGSRVQRCIPPLKDSLLHEKQRCFADLGWVSYLYIPVFLFLLLFPIIMTKKN